ncbi:cytochrome c biogenesis CcdA family protein [Nocardioides sp. NPDC057772]|uniref:cytochrome c biogenesis CcdA family protein n=1 Tax=Nocardioides sp. NPDC057772 TaxID=3346245 RepID=UPI003670FC9B
MNGLQETVLAGPLLLASLVAVTAGIVSFFSPCSLPLVPGYLSYVAGVSGQESVVVRDLRGNEPSPRGRGRTLLGATLFVLGFALVFTSYGALFGALGSQLVLHQATIIRISGGSPSCSAWCSRFRAPGCRCWAGRCACATSPASAWPAHRCWASCSA